MKWSILIWFVLVLCWGENCCFPQRGSDQSENSSTSHTHAGSSSSSSGSGTSLNKRRAQHSTRNNLVASTTTSKASMLDVNGPQLSKWVGAALKYFDFTKCTATNIGSEDECFKLGQIRRGQVAVYLGYSRIEGGNASSKGFGPLEKVYAILPDSSSPKSSGPHDAVLVLDPYPISPYGHLVAMFYLDFAGVDDTMAQCKDELQTLTSDGTCITVGRKHRCPNLIDRFTSSGHGHVLQSKRCHVDFLPTVYSAERVSLPPLVQVKTDLTQSRFADLLECLPLQGFASCPKLRTLDDTSKVLCDSALANSKRCDTSHATVGYSCKLFQSCDRAILIGGGWNRGHSPVQSLSNIDLMEESLKEGGFASDNIQIFYANGKGKAILPTFIPPNGRPLNKPSRNGDYFSSAMKTALRGHIRDICDNRHCADTLFIYLNNPTTYEGDFLLWDMDYNGIADELETYTIKEFLSDLSACEAKRVVVMVEQANSDILMASLKTSSDHQNVILFSAGLPNEVLTGGEFTKRWANSSSNPIACLRHVYQIAASYTKGSNPVFYDPTHGVSSKLSLVGAPCDLNPPVSSKELKTLYQGCQNVPTSIWFSFDFEEIDTAEIQSPNPNGSGGGDSPADNSSSDQELTRRSSEGSFRPEERHHHHHRPRHSKKRRRAPGGSSRSKLRTSASNS